jgi:hypothetical protein
VLWVDRICGRPTPSTVVPMMLVDIAVCTPASGPEGQSGLLTETATTMPAEISVARARCTQWHLPGAAGRAGAVILYRLILKYAYPITAVILVIFAWVIYRRIAQGWSEIITLAIAAVTVWVLGAPIFIYLGRASRSTALSGRLSSVVSAAGRSP